MQYKWSLFTQRGTSPTRHHYSYWYLIVQSLSTPGYYYFIYLDCATFLRNQVPVFLWGHIYLVTQCLIGSDEVSVKTGIHIQYTFCYYSGNGFCILPCALHPKGNSSTGLEMLLTPDHCTLSSQAKYNRVLVSCNPLLPLSPSTSLAPESQTYFSAWQACLLKFKIQLHASEVLPTILKLSSFDR